MLTTNLPATYATFPDAGVDVVRELLQKYLPHRLRFNNEESIYDPINHFLNPRTRFFSGIASLII
jgi:hypothetical protein